KARTRLGGARPPRKRLGLFLRVAVVTLFWCLVGVGLVLTFGDDSDQASSAGPPVTSAARPVTSMPPPTPVGPFTPVRVYQGKRAENTPIGTCVSTEAGWNGDKAAVPSVPCDQEHWGEILAYPPLGPAPSTYPGEEQTAALAQYQCRYAQKQQGLDNPDYVS